MRISTLPDGSPVSDSSRYQNIYVALHDDNVIITTRNINLSLAYIEDSFISKVVNDRLKEMYGNRKPDPAIARSVRMDVMGRKSMVKDKQGYWHAERLGGLDATVHMMYDRETGNAYYISANFPQGEDAELNALKRSKIHNKVSEWIGENNEDDSLETSFYPNAPIPYQDYEIHRISDYIGVYNYIQRTGLPLDLDGNEKVLLVDCRDQRMLKLAKDTVGYDGRDFECVNSSFSYVDDDGKEAFKVTPPFYFINTEGKGVAAVTRSIVTLLMDDLYDAAIDAASGNFDIMSKISLSRVKNEILMDIDIGKNLGEIMHGRISDSISGNGGPEIDNEASWVPRLTERFGLEGNDILINFMKTLFSMTDMFKKSENEKLYSKTYYYIAKRTSEIEYEDFFGTIFNVVDTAEDGINTFDILSSWYSVPEGVLMAFGYESACDQKVYDHNSGILTSSLEYCYRTIDPEFEFDSDYVRNRVPLYTKVSEIVEESFEGDQITNNIDMFASVQMLEDYPMVYSEVKDMFADRNLPYRPIPVILLYDKENPGTLGGFYPAYTGGNPALSERGMVPPYITLNIFSRSNRDSNRIVEILIHEASHYIDDIMVNEGIESKDIMFNPERAKTQADMERFWKEYLASPTEFTAHLMQTLSNLKYFNREVVAADREALKSKFLRTLYMRILENTIPIAQDIAPGDSSIRVTPDILVSNSDLVGSHVDIVEKGSVERYFSTGVQEFDTVGITGTDEDEVAFIVDKPLTFGALVANGAVMSIPTVGDINLHGVRAELYGDIIDKAFDLYIAGGEIPRGI